MGINIVEYLGILMGISSTYLIPVFGQFVDYNTYTMYLEENT